MISFEEFVSTNPLRNSADWDIHFEQYWEAVIGENVLYCMQLKEFFMWNTKIYAVVDKLIIQKICRKYLIHFEVSRSAKRLNLCLNIIMENHPIQYDQFDEDKQLLCFNNGVFDVEAKLFLTHKQEYRQTIMLNINYVLKPNPTPFIDEFRSHYHDKFFMIERFVQSILHNDNTHEQMLNLYGPTRSGKGTILNLISAVFRKSLVKSSLADLGDNFGLSLLVNKTLFIDPEMTIKGFDNKTVRVCKTLTGGDCEQGVIINPKGVKQFNAPLKIWIITATNQFGNLPYGTDSLAWYSRTNIIHLNISFKSNPALKNGILEEIDDWISELLLLPYHNWTIGMDKSVEWVPKQQHLWEQSSKIYQNIGKEFFKKELHGNLAAHDVLNFYIQIMQKRNITVPNERVLMGKITSALAALGVVRKTYGRARKAVYHNICPIDEKLWLAITDTECDEDETCTEITEEFL